MNDLLEKLRDAVLTAKAPSPNVESVVKVEAVLKLCSELLNGQLTKVPKTSCPKWLQREVASLIEECHHYLVKITLSKDELSYNVQHTISLNDGASDDETPTIKPSAKKPPVVKKAKKSPQHNDSATKEPVNFSTRSFSHHGICLKRSKSHSPISEIPSHIFYDPAINPVRLDYIEQNDRQLLYRKLKIPSPLTDMITMVRRG